MSAPQDRRVVLANQVLTWIGILEHLVRTRASRTLAELDLPFPQFVLLSHLVRRGDEVQTVTRIARAMQQPQPGITKTLQKMAAAGLVRERPDPEDRRVKQIELTARGRNAYWKGVAALEPQFAGLFADWSATELEDIAEKLDRLKRWMDTQGRV